jgi:outer membrane receptor protein involved in Fe transport
LTEQNEFVLSNVQLRNENTAIDFYGGFKGALSKKMSFNVGASFARIKDKAFFVTDTVYSVGNKFNVIYDTLSLTTIEGSLSYQLNEKLKIDAIGRYYSYSLLNNAYAWNMPDWQAIARGSYNLFDKFLINLDLNFEGGRKALVYTMEDDVIEENLQYAKPLGLIADINLGLEYRYNKRISAFIQLNNVASQRYNRWYNYPVQVFQVLGGITARF